MKKRKGIELLSEQVGTGEPVQKGSVYRMTTRIWLNQGEPVIRAHPLGDSVDLRIDREGLFAGLLYTVLDMRVGGTRKVRIAPHLAYRDRGVEGIIPPNAVLIVEVSVHERRL